MLSMPNYKGISDHQKVNFSLALSTGLYMKGDIAGIKAGVDRYTFGTLLEEPWKINITIFLRIKTRKNADVWKEITY
jgi:hypothetical protein